MLQSDRDVSLLLRLRDNRIQKYKKIIKSKQVFTVLGILTAVLFFINFIPFSYADLITGLVVGTNPNGIAYGNGNVYVANGGGNFVSVVNDLTNLVIATIPVGMYPYGVAYGNGNVYVTNYGDNTVSVISSSTNSVLATVPVGRGPMGIVYGNGIAYVANYDDNTVSVIDSSTNSVLATVPVGTNPMGVAYGNGNVYVTNNGANTVSVISSSTNSVLVTLPVGASPYGVTYGNGNVYVANNRDNTVSVISSATNSVLSTVPVGASPYGVAFGIGNVYVVNLASGSVSVISSATNSVVATIPVGTNPAWDAFDPNNGYIYVSFPYGNSISTINGIIQSPTPTPTATSPPSISITSPANGALVSVNTLTISGNVSASTTIQSVQVSIDGNTLNPATVTTSWSFVITLLTSGMHTITATATDINGNTAKTSVTITIDTPPTLNLPADITVSPTSTAGAIVTYTVTASDDGGPVSPVCSPPSGSTFSFGAKVVNCTVTDSAGNKVTGSFNVTVLNPGQAIQQLINTVNGMNLPISITTYLDSKLSSAFTYYNSGLYNNAKNNLNTFTNNVGSTCCFPNKSLTNIQANLLTSTAQNIINSIP